LKILHFYKTALPATVGGVQQVIHDLAAGAAKAGHDVQVLTLGDSNRHDDVGGYHVSQCRSDFEFASSPVSAPALAAFRRLAAEADIVHYHYPWPFMDLSHFAARIACPSVVTYHSDIVRQKIAGKLYAPLRELFLNSVSSIVATSPNYAATSPVLQRHSSKVSVIPLGINDDDAPAPAEKIAYWRERLGGPFFLFVGVLRYYKGLHILLDAAAGTDLPIAIVGAGPIEGELRAQADALKLKNVHFLGRLSNEDKAALLGLSLATVFPSHLRAEAFGISLLEGAMHGKPLISSEIGTGTSYVNVDGVTGLVVPPNNPAALLSAMLQMWSDPQLARQMGQRARQRFEALFTADRMVAGYLALYENLRAGRKSERLIASF